MASICIKEKVQNNVNVIDFVYDAHKGYQK